MEDEKAIYRLLPVQRDEEMIRIFGREVEYVTIGIHAYASKSVFVEILDDQDCVIYRRCREAEKAKVEKVWSSHIPETVGEYIDENFFRVDFYKGRHISMYCLLPDDYYIVINESIGYDTIFEFEGTYQLCLVKDDRPGILLL